MDICFAFASWLCLYSFKKLIFPEDEFLFQYTVIFFLPIVKGKQEQQQQQKNAITLETNLYFTTRGCQAPFLRILL